LDVPDPDQYVELLQHIEEVCLLIRRLEADPPSAKRDAAVELLRQRHGDAIRRLNQIRSDSHSN
jgi:hypothetical protein